MLLFPFVSEIKHLILSYLILVTLGNDVSETHATRACYHNKHNNQPLIDLLRRPCLCYQLQS